jgi:hypothetical protein
MMLLNSSQNFAADPVRCITWEIPNTERNVLRVDGALTSVFSVRDRGSCKSIHLDRELMHA